MELVLKKTIDEERIRTFLQEVLKNLPEASLNLACTSFDYEESVFNFVDIDGDDEAYELGMEDFVRAFEILIKKGLAGDFNVGGWAAEGVFGDDMAWQDWECDWDAEVVDGLVQCAIFKDVIYG